MDSNIDEDLLIKLKALRSELAKEEAVPAYVIFPDAALVDMCRKRPCDIVEFLSVSGVGKTKQEKYGQRFLDVILKHTGMSGKSIHDKSEGSGDENTVSDSDLIYDEACKSNDFSKEDEFNKSEIERMRKKLRELGVID